MKQQAITPSDSIEASWTVNEVIRIFPDTVTVFNAFGVDSCCGGAASLEEAALDAGADRSELISALRAAVDNARNSAGSAR
jgi:iron-sulfur cluster repair protein YtfE (RIC family)